MWNKIINRYLVGFLGTSIFLLFLPISYAATISQLSENLVVVDKKDNEVHLVDYDEGKLKVRRSFHATLGKVPGDKMEEGDLKTPDGIYEISSRLIKPQIKPIFGPLALYVTYPNAYDRKLKKTGFDILIHGTDNPSRLKKDFDTKGCVALANEEVKVVSDFTKLKNTKVIITENFHDLLKSDRLPKAQTFLKNWISAWEEKKIDTYASLYDKDFSYDGKDLQSYIKYKEGLNLRYATIQVEAEHPHFFFHEKYDVIEFFQKYRATDKSGRIVFEKELRKRLWLEHNPQEKYRIAVEQVVL